MRIAFFGNTNNYPIALAFEFRRRGFEVTVVLSQSGVLHRPENLNAAWKDGYPGWIVDASTIKPLDIIRDPDRLRPVLAALDQADVLLLNHLGPALMNRLARRPTVALLTGSDLDFYASKASIDSICSNWAPTFRGSPAGAEELGTWVRLLEAQREGIAKSDAVSYFPRGVVPTGDAILDDLGVPEARRFFVNFGEPEAEWYEPPPVHRRPVLFCGARVTWKLPIPLGSSTLDYKGTNLLLMGMREYLDTGGSDLELRLVEKGMHVAETRSLIVELRLESNVVWLKEMDRPAFRAELRDADVVVDQLGSSVIGMAGLEGMAVGRPLLANVDLDYWESALGKCPPICKAATVEEICAQLHRLLRDEVHREELGHASLEFIRQYWSVRAAVDRCCQRLGIKNRFINPRASDAARLDGARH